MVVVEVLIPSLSVNYKSENFVGPSIAWGQAHWKTHWDCWDPLVFSFWASLSNPKPSVAHLDTDSRRPEAC